MPAVHDLIAELTVRSHRQSAGRHAVLAETLPLLHRCGHALEFMQSLNNTSMLVPGEGSAARVQLGLAGNTFEWVGHCAYPGHVILIWEARRDELGGWTAPWDTAGLLSKATLGRNVTHGEALAALERYSLDSSSYRTYLSAVLECSFADAEDYLHGYAPRNWYPGWEGDPQRVANPPAHTFEVRRPGESPAVEGLVAVVVDETEFANSPAPLRKLRSFLRSAGVRYEATRAGERAEGAANRLVIEYLTEMRCI